MNLLSSSSNVTRTMTYVMICTLIIAFGAIGSVLAGNFGEQFSLIGLFLGSALGAFIAVYESSIIGCIIGMIIGVILAPLIYFFIDFETAYLAVFITSLMGAILGEPVASFWNEAEYSTEGSDDEPEADASSDKNN